VEFGAAEVGKSFDGEHASKWLYESNLKLPKILRDMFFALGEKVTWHPEVLNPLQTIGYVHVVSVIHIVIKYRSYGNNKVKHRSCFEIDVLRLPQWIYHASHKRQIAGDTCNGV
jgi:hypothetical protein